MIILQVGDFLRKTQTAQPTDQATASWREIVAIAGGVFQMETADHRTFPPRARLMDSTSKVDEVVLMVMLLVVELA
jgi:hypothetical protein